MNHSRGDAFVEREVSETYLGILEQRRAALERDALRVEGVFDSILCSAPVTSLLAERNTPYEKAVRIFEFRGVVEAQTRSSEVRDVTVHGSNGVRFYAREILFSPTRPFEETEWHRRAAAAPGMLWFGVRPYELAPNLSYVIASKPVRRLVDGKPTVLGLGFLALDRSFFADRLADIGREGPVHVVDAAGTVLYSSVEGAAGRRAADLGLRLRETAEASYYVERAEGGERMAVVGSPNVLGWRIAHQRPFPSLVGRFRVLRVLLYGTALLGFLALAAYTLLYLRRVGELSRGMRKAEIEKLEAQISPHFLDNVLGNIKFMALLDRQERILRVVDPLIRLLHASLDPSSPLIPLGRETENLRHYVRIMDRLYEDGILFRWELEAGLDDCLVPRFLLQPIVENAIYHGIDPSSGTGRITVRSRRDGEGLALEVEDNGVGFPQGLLGRLPGNGSLAPVSIGLWNTHRKVQLLYGGRYGVDIGRGEDRGARVTIRLPAVRSAAAARIAEYRRR